MGCNKKLYNVLGGFGYYNTMEVKISVNKEQFFLQYFLYNMQDLKMGSFFLVSEKIDKKYWKIVGIIVCPSI